MQECAYNGPVLLSLDDGPVSAVSAAVDAAVDAAVWSWTALGVYGTGLVVAFGLRTWLHRRTTGSSGFHGVPGRPGSAAWWGGVLFPVAVVLDLVGLIASGLDPDLVWRAPAPVAVIGCAVALVGLVGTVWAQGGLGVSWRIGVDDGERTELVTDGPFRWVRNPVFTAMAVVTAGVALMAPSAATVAAFAVLVAAVQLQVRVVEEPYLARLHGSSYATYAMRVGRFLPYLGRARSGSMSDEMRTDA